MSVNAVRKLSSDQEVQILAKGLIKSWKKLLRKCVYVIWFLFLFRKTALCVCGGADGDRKKDGSPVRTSSKDSGSSEKRFLQSHTDDVTLVSQLLFLL